MMDETLNMGAPQERKTIDKKFVAVITICAIFGVAVGMVLYSVISPRNNMGTPNDEVTTTVVTDIVPTALPTTPKPVPATGLDDEVIESARTTTECDLEVVTSNKTYTIKGESMGSTNKCVSTKTGEISPSKKHLAYTDTSGGVDSVMALFSVKYGHEVVLGVWGTSQILDYMFLPDDKLVTVNGYPDLFGEQYLSLFDIPAIEKNMAANIDPENWYLSVRNPFFQIGLTLPDTGRDHARLDFAEGKIQTKDSLGRLLVQYDPTQLAEMVTGRYTVSAKDAIELVREADKPNMNPADYPKFTLLINQSDSTFDYWRVDIKDRTSGENLRSYTVDAKTGEAVLN